MGKRKVFLGAIALAACMCMVTSVVAEDDSSFANMANVTPEQSPAGELEAYIAAGGGSGGPRACEIVYQSASPGDGWWVAGLDQIWLDDVELVGTNREVCEVTWTMYSRAPVTPPYDAVCYIYDACPVVGEEPNPDATLIATATGVGTASGWHDITFTFAGELLPDVRPDNPPTCDGTLDFWVGVRVVGADSSDAGPGMRVCVPVDPEIGCSDIGFGEVTYPVVGTAGDSCNYWFGACPENPPGTFMVTITADSHPGACCHTDDGTCDEVGSAGECVGLYDVFYPEMNCPGGLDPIVCDAITGACCNDDTGFCDIGIAIGDCLGADRDGSTGGDAAPWLVGPTRFIPDGVCADFLPLCGEGACCYGDGAAAGEPGACDYMTYAACDGTGTMIAFIPGGICEGDSGLVDPGQEPQPEEFNRCYVVPVNDICEDAIEIFGGATTTYDNSGATMADIADPDVDADFVYACAEPSSVTTRVPLDCSVWFSYEVTCEGDFLVSVIGVGSDQDRMDPVVDVWYDSGALPCEEIRDDSANWCYYNDDLLDYTDGDDPCGLAAGEGVWVGTLAYLGSDKSAKISFNLSDIGNVVYLRVSGVADQGNEFGEFDLYVECRQEQFGRCMLRDFTCYDAEDQDCEADPNFVWWTEDGRYCQQITCATEELVRGEYCKWGIIITPPAIDATETVTGTVPAGDSLFYSFTIPEEYPFIIDTCGSDFDTVINVWNTVTGVEAHCGFLNGDATTARPPIILAGAVPIVTNDDCLSLGGLPCSPVDPTPNGESCVCYDPDLHIAGLNDDIIIEIVNGGTTDGALNLSISQLGDVACPDCLFDCGCKGDLTLDGIINGLDIQAFLNVLVEDPQDCTQEAWCIANMNSDLDVNMTDLAWFVYALLIPYDCDGDDIACGDEGYCQLPDQAFSGTDGVSGATSTHNEGLDVDYYVADNFMSFSGGNITKVCWWGFYLDIPAWPADCDPQEGDSEDNFTITYYSDAGGMPGSVIAQFSDIKLTGGTYALTKTATGLGVPLGDTSLEYMYEVEHPAVLAGPSVCMWIEIQNTTTANCGWLWETSDIVDDLSFQKIVPGAYAVGNASAYDLAFCVNVPVSASACPKVCEIDCPEGAIAEGEVDCEDAYVDVFNGGCFADTPVFSALSCGDTVCGTAGIFDIDSEYIGRDTDWYEIVLTESTGLDLTFDTEFQLLYYVFEAPCPAEGEDFVIAAGGYIIYPCPGEMVGVGAEYVNAGTYYVAVMPDFDYEGEYPGMQPCGSNYTMSFACETCAEYTDCLTCVDNEGETCGTSANGGCHTDPLPEVYGAIACGGTICGTAWADGGTRDTDWYEFTTTEEQLVTATLSSEFEGIVLILSVTACDPMDLTTHATSYSADCVPGAAPALLPAGTYVVFVASGNVEGPIFDCLPCGGFNDYELTLTCEEPPPGCTYQQGCQNLLIANAVISDDNATALAALPQDVYSAADNFMPTSTGNISNVCWYGFYAVAGWTVCDPQGNGIDDFTITYYEDDGSGSPYAGRPGAVYAGPFNVGAAAKFATIDTFNAMEIFRYEATHAATEFIGGTCYWIEIMNSTTGDCFWAWVSGEAGDYASYYDTDGSDTYDAGELQANDMNFCLDLAIEAEGCGLAQGACCLAGQICTATNNRYECAALSGVWYEGEACPAFACPTGCGDPVAACAAQDTYGEDEYIENIAIGTIDHASGWAPYSDFTGVACTNVVAGATSQLTVVFGVAYGADQLGVWVDWDNDGDFTSAGEEMTNRALATMTELVDVVVPAGQAAGDYRMRVRLHYTSGAATVPCGETSTGGEVEDYTLIVP